ncbi:MAG: class I SAM-dependent methyltransferase [Myxococcota bacterium]
MGADDPTAKNRAWWNATSDAYQRSHGALLAAAPLAWGVWRVPEAELRVLGDVAGKDVLELGCGAAQWAVGLAGCAARVVGVDFSERQLAHARGVAAAAGVDLPLVLASAERAPFGDASFDVVFCDHGAMTFARPEHTVAEAARLLKPGGCFAFCMSSPLRDLCWDSASDTVTSSLRADYFDLHSIEDRDSVCYQLPYGEWIRLFRRHSLVVEDLVELRPPARAKTSYADYVSLGWASRWPGENIWKLTRQ